MFKRKKDLGSLGEDAAVHFLTKRGYRIIKRNWYNVTGRRVGEIDIVAMYNNTIVFIEVKTTVISGMSCNPVEERITAQKMQKMQRIVELYIATHDLWDVQWQCDAISVYMKEHKVVKVDHLQHIFI